MRLMLRIKNWRANWKPNASTRGPGRAHSRHCRMRIAPPESAPSGPCLRQVLSHNCRRSLFGFALDHAQHLFTNDAGEGPNQEPISAKFVFCDSAKAVNACFCAHSCDVIQFGGKRKVPSRPSVSFSLEVQDLFRG